LDVRTLPLQVSGFIPQPLAIAIVERFIRSLKTECTRLVLVPLELSAFQLELALYAGWFNTFRPHQGLDGLVPAERHEAIKQQTPANKRQRDNLTLQPLALDVSYFAGRKHLPIVRLRPAA